jgi:hypothetical protein
MNDECWIRPGEPARGSANRIASQGIALLAHALNACDNTATPYKYAPDARARFMELASKIVELVETGRILPNPIGLARNDDAFQSFMALARRRPRRARP